MTFRIALLLLAAAAASAASRAAPIEIRIGDAPPAPVVEHPELVRLSDGARIAAVGGMHDFSPGAYLCGDRVLLLRADDSVAGRALALVGLPILSASSAWHAQSKAENAVGFDRLSLVVQVWRQVDGYDWPFVRDAGYWTGLAGMCRRLNPKRIGFAFDKAEHAYVDEAGTPIAIGQLRDGAKAVAPGDLVSVDGVFGLLVQDRGAEGLLDPADVVVTAAGVDGQPFQVRAMAIGNLFGDAGVFLFSRDRAGADRIRKQSPSLAAMNSMDKTSQWALTIGIVLLVGITMRKNKQWQRRLKNKSHDPRAGIV